MFVHAFTYRIPYEQTAKFVPLTGLTRLTGSCEEAYEPGWPGLLGFQDLFSLLFPSKNLDVFI